jgi:hypothetical protein
MAEAGDTLYLRHRKSGWIFDYEGFLKETPKFWWFKSAKYGIVSQTIKEKYDVVTKQEWEEWGREWERKRLLRQAWAMRHRYAIADAIVTCSTPEWLHEAAEAIHYHDGEDDQDIWKD